MRESKILCSLFGLIMSLCFNAYCIDIGSVIQGDEAILHVERFGRGTPVVISNGYLFIDFKYIPPPYVIQRVGQAVTVNHIIVNCLYTNSIPDTFERKVSEVRGSDGRMHTVSLPPHPASWLKGTADAHVSALSNTLSFAANFLPGARNPPVGSKEATSWKPRFMPVVAKISLEEFPRALLAAVSVEGDDNYWTTAKKACTRWSLSKEDTIRLVKEAKATPLLMERLRREDASLAQKLNSGLPAVRVSSDFAVVNIMGYEWKLTVRYEDGVECYVGADMEIRDILFDPDDITVEAYRNGLRYPLPKTKHIRVAPKLKAVIRSCKTDMVFKVWITDSLNNVISIDDVQYQVIDIRADTGSVLMKNCLTGEKILVVSQKGTTGKEAK